MGATGAKIPVKEQEKKDLAAERKPGTLLLRRRLIKGES